MRGHTTGTAVGQATLLGVTQRGTAALVGHGRRGIRDAEQRHGELSGGGLLESQNLEDFLLRVGDGVLRDRPRSVVALLRVVGARVGAGEVEGRLAHANLFSKHASQQPWLAGSGPSSRTT